MRKKLAKGLFARQYGQKMFQSTIGKLIVNHINWHNTLDGLL